MQTAPHQTPPNHQNMDPFCTDIHSYPYNPPFTVSTISMKSPNQPSSGHTAFIRMFLTCVRPQIWHLQGGGQTNYRPEL